MDLNPLAAGIKKYIELGESYIQIRTRVLAEGYTEQEFNLGYHTAMASWQQDNINKIPLSSSAIPTKIPINSNGINQTVSPNNQSIDQEKIAIGANDQQANALIGLGFFALASPFILIFIMQVLMYLGDCFQSSFWDIRCQTLPLDELMNTMSTFVLILFFVGAAGFVSLIPGFILKIRVMAKRHKRREKMFGGLFGILIFLIGLFVVISLVSYFLAPFLVQTQLEPAVLLTD